MQTLDVISVNLWNVLISLANLLLLFWIIKSFLYQPVKKMLDNRKDKIDGTYKSAEEAEKTALLHKKEYEEKLSGAKKEADEIIHSAVQTAKNREKDILTEAKSEADRILQRAEENAALELKKAENTIKGEIVEVSTLLSEKILGREIKAEDHQSLIDDFINGIGENNEDQQ